MKDSRDRWPRWVYESGDEPDYRFSFANERTFLAWIRTALTFIAGGVALDAVDLSLSPTLQLGLASLALTLGLGCALAAWIRWARAEHSIRNNRPLPAPSFAAAIATVVALIAVALVASIAQVL